MDDAESVDNQMRVMLEDEPQARCMDGSPAGYFIRVADPRRWLIFLQGGGLCFSRLDCQSRLASDLGSSSYWPILFSWKRGIWSSNRSAMFAGWSQVFAPYCSGDLWLGTGQQHSPGLKMNGHLILEALINRLLNTTSIVAADHVVFAGTSAGGIGVFHHVDWVATKLAEAARNITAGPGPAVVGLPFAGVYFPENWPVLFESFFPPLPSILYADVAEDFLTAVQSPFMHEGCTEYVERQGGQAKECWSVSAVLPYIRSRLFIVQNRFDQNQIMAEGACPLHICTAESDPASRPGLFVRYFGDQMRFTLAKAVEHRPDFGLYVPSFLAHDGNLMRYTSGAKPTFEIDGVQIKDAFNGWLLHNQTVHLFAPTCNDEGPCITGVEEGIDKGGLDVQPMEDKTVSLSLTAAIFLIVALLAVLGLGFTATCISVRKAFSWLSPKCRSSGSALVSDDEYQDNGGI